MDSFKASTHYADWKGTASADDAHNSIHELLRKMGLIKENEFLLSVSFFSIEGSFFVSAKVFEGMGNVTGVEQYLAEHVGSIPVREAKFEMPPSDFLGLFKQFDVLLTWDGLKLEGREYSARKIEAERTGSLN